jgi:hypothetical protein
MNVLFTMKIFNNFILSLKNSFFLRKEESFLIQNKEFLNELKNKPYTEELLHLFGLNFEEVIVNQKKIIETLIKGQNDKEYKKLAFAMAKNYPSDNAQSLKENMLIFSFFLDENILTAPIFEKKFKVSNPFLSDQVSNFYNDKNMFDFIVYKCCPKSFSMSLIDEKNITLENITPIEKIHLSFFQFIISKQHLSEKLIKYNQVQMLSTYDKYYNRYTNDYMLKQILMPLWQAGLDINLIDSMPENSKMLNDVEKIKSYINVFKEKEHFENMLYSKDKTETKVVKSNKKL